MRVHAFLAAALAVCVPGFSTFASDTPPPVVSSFTVSNGVKTLKFAPSPAVDAYNLRSGSVVTDLFTNDATGVVSNFTYRVTNSLGMKFYNVGATPISSNALL